jgi:surfactin synthase thioesterase subunit
VLFFGDLTQVRRYQRDDELARDVLDRVREALDVGRPRVMIGHSLGSIVAYEALCMIRWGCVASVPHFGPRHARSFRLSRRGCRYG